MSENKHLTPVWIAYADGKRLDTEHEGALEKLIVVDKLNGISTAKLVFDTSAVKLRDAGKLSLESQIVIHMGYKDDVDEVFDGEITGFRTVLDEYGNEKLEVRASSTLYKLQHGTHYRTFEEKSVSDSIKEVLDAYSLKADIDSFGAAQLFSAAQGMSDYDFVMNFAHLYGKDVWAYGTDVYIKDEIKVHTDEIIFEWGKSLISFEAEQNISKLLSKVSMIGWDPLKNESFNGEASLSDLGVKVGGSKDWTKSSKGGGGKWESIMIDNAVFDAEDAKNIAKGQLQNNSCLFYSASGKGEGNYKLHAGMRVNIKYTGEQFSGEYIAESVTHAFDYRSGYTTGFSLKRNMSV